MAVEQCPKGLKRTDRTNNNRQADLTGRTIIDEQGNRGPYDVYNKGAFKYEQPSHSQRDIHELIHIQSSRKGAVESEDEDIAKVK